MMSPDPLVSRLPVEYGPPSISINGPDGAYSVYDLQRQIGPRTRSNGLWQYTDVLSWQRGTHFLKFGADFAHRLVTFQQARNPRANFGFDGTYTGSALADFMLGYVKTAGINPTHTNTDLHDWTQAYFIQDDWKINSRLTLNLGNALRLLRSLHTNRRQIRRYLPERFCDYEHSFI
jgi:hypothetical protein